MCVCFTPRSFHPSEKVGEKTLKIHTILGEPYNTERIKIFAFQNFQKVKFCLRILFSQKSLLKVVSDSNNRTINDNFGIIKFGDRQFRMNSIECDVS